ncbi:MULTISPECIES: immunoglobulin-like domain-containing protein [unclassified Actinomyces]|uniref:immunoglobulin-like domain-containing protein n=1 Tax=unclassified Actinomyces TaxID=2609248 RepID=UPI00131ED5A3|nr:MULTISPECIES: immunoglobulin-like domain-containing protein [unclassified Actinomyces]
MPLTIPDRRRARRIRAGLGRAAAAALLAAPLAPAVAFAAELPDPYVHYTFDSAAADGTVADAAGSGLAATVSGEGAAFAEGSISLPGGANGSGAAFVSIPGAAYAGQEAVTISIWMTNATGSDNYAGAYVGNADRTKGYWLLNPANPSGAVKSVITSATAANPAAETWNTEIGSTQAPARSSLSLYTTVISGATGTMSFYLDGVKISSHAIATDLTDFGDLVAFIGKSPYPDRFFKGTVDDYAVYHEALTDQQVSELYADQAAERAEVLAPAAIESALAVVAAKVPAEAVETFTVPVTSGPVGISWSSSEPGVINVDGDGVASVSRPRAEEGDAAVTLTATYSFPGADPAVRTYTVKVSADQTDTAKVSADAEALVIHNADDMRSNFSVPTVGAAGSAIAWEVIEPGAADPRLIAGVRDGSATYVIKRPSAGSDPTIVVLRATVTSGDVAQTKDIAVTVQPMPSVQAEEAYVWAFFTGEGQGAEKISIAASKGNDALAWNTLNDGNPLIESTEGTGGLRDPFIIRSHDGDRFYMLATDLKVAGLPGGFTTAQRTGSKYLEIWESTDLVSWSEQRHVKVSSDYAGNTWAPEAYWDAELGKYVVYWASNLYDTVDSADRTSLTYNRMMYVTTDDFVTFSEPRVWIDSVRKSGTDGLGTIDVTVAEEDGVYYRVYKDEGDMTLREEKSTVLTSTVSGDLPGAEGAPDQWTLITERIAAGLPNGVGTNTFVHGEGPSIFKANADDINGAAWYLFIDQPDYHGGPNHYVPFATDKPLADTSAADWYSAAAKLSSNLPQNADGGRPRHGTVIPVTRAEYQTVLLALQPDIAVSAVEQVSVTTTLNTQPSLPSTVELTMADGSVQEAGVTWAPITAESLASPGQIRVRGTAANDTREPVEAVVTVLPVNEPDSEPSPVPTPSPTRAASGESPTPAQAATGTPMTRAQESAAAAAPVPTSAPPSQNPASVNSTTAAPIRRDDNAGSGGRGSLPKTGTGLTGLLISVAFVGGGCVLVALRNSKRGLYSHPDPR